MVKKREGFKGQKLFVIPAPIKELAKKDSILSQLYITDIGHYPKAKSHYVERNANLPQFILIYCIHGNGWVQIKGEPKVSIEAGDLVIIPSNCAHSYGTKDNNSWSIYWIHFRGTQAETMAQRICKKNWGVPVKIKKNSDIILLFDHIIKDLEYSNYDNTYAYANYQLWHLFGSFIHHHKVCEVTEDLINETIAFMVQNINSTLTLSELANQAKKSKSYFCELFKRQTGSSPLDFFINLKMQEACKHLVFSDSKIKEISQILGYDDQYYFSRIFTKIIGQSPTEFRRKKFINKVTNLNG